MKQVEMKFQSTAFLFYIVCLISGMDARSIEVNNLIFLIPYSGDGLYFSVNFPFSEKCFPGDREDGGLISVDRIIVNLRNNACLRSFFF